MQETNFIVICPHCKDVVIVEQINCAIFRHGILKTDYSQMHPHLPKFKCDELIAGNMIYGCGKPFKIIKQNDKFIAIICDYI